MDTIDVRVDNHNLAQEIIATIKAKAKAQDADRAKLSEEWSFMEPVNRRWKSMSQRLLCSYDSRKTYVAFKPWTERPGAIPLRMSFHASHYENLEHMMQWMDELMGNTLGDAFREEAVLTRVDAAIDVLLPHDTMRRLIDIPGCQRLQLYRSKKGNSIIFGADELKQTIAYSKELLASRFDWVPSEVEIATLDGNMMGTRVEAKYIGSRIPKGLKKWRDLPKMATLNPFSNLRQLPIGAEVPFTLEGNGIPLRVYSYQYLADKTSAAEAKRVINKRGGHFNRDVGKYLIQYERIDFAVAWRTRCERFFGPQHLSKEAK